MITKNMTKFYNIAYTFVTKIKKKKVLITNFKYFKYWSKCYKIINMI